MAVWVHLKCNKFNLVGYKYLQGLTDPCLCLSCCSIILPFGKLTDKDFSYSVLNNYIEISNKNSSFLLKPPPNWHSYLISLIISHKKRLSLSSILMHVYETKIFDDLVYFLKCKNKYFGIIAVSETITSKKTSVTSSVNLNNYSFESTLAESSAVGMMLYISNHLSYKPRSGLNTHKKNQIESTFIETINSKKSIIVVSCVYKLPIMDVLDFNFLINQLLDKISKEQKQIFLLGDFSINLLNYNEHQPAS